MSDDVEHCASDAIRAAEPVHHHDVAILGDGRIGKYLLEHIAGQRHHATDHHRRRTDRHQRIARPRLKLDQRIDAPDQEHARRHHRGGMEV